MTGPRRPGSWPGSRTAGCSPAPGSHLTASQLGYLTSFMRPCPASQVTSATHRVTWNDSAGIPNVAHAGPSVLGPVVPVVAREATLALWRALAANKTLAARAARLDDAARQVLTATTTDAEPGEIFRIGVEATARTLIQHACIADQTPYRSPAEFARGMPGQRPAARTTRQPAAGVFFAGNLCLERDMIFNHLTFVDRVPEPGDIVAFVNTAAYQMDLSASAALMRSPPRRAVAWSGQDEFTMHTDD